MRYAINCPKGHTVAAGNGLNKGSKQISHGFQTSQSSNRPLRQRKRSADGLVAFRYQRATRMELLVGWGIVILLVLHHSTKYPARVECRCGNCGLLDNDSRVACHSRKQSGLTDTRLPTTKDCGSPLFVSAQRHHEPTGASLAAIIVLSLPCDKHLRN